MIEIHRPLDRNWFLTKIQERGVEIANLSTRIITGSIKSKEGKAKIKKFKQAKDDTKQLLSNVDSIMQQDLPMAEKEKLVRQLIKGGMK